MTQMPAPMTAFDDDSAANPPRIEVVPSVAPQSEGVSVNALRASLDREVAGAVAPLGEALRLSRDAAGAMRAELERLEGRFREIQAEAADLAGAAGGAEGGAGAGGLGGERIACSEEVARRLESLCGEADGAQQRLLEAVEAAGEVVGVMGVAPERVEDLEARGGRLMRACDEVEARQRDLAAEAERRRAEIERIAEMPLARIEAAADAAAARLEALIDRASEAAARAQEASVEQEALESSLQEATERLAPWAPVVAGEAGEAPGPVADLLGLVRSELHQEVASLGDGLTKLAEAIVELAQARPARRAAPKRPTAQIEAKPRRASATARAATSMKTVARGGGAGTKSSRRTTSRGKAALRGAKAKAGANSKAGAGAKRRGSRGKGARKTAAGRRR